MEGGPKKCRYLSTKSGWFGAAAFSDEFESLMFPKLKKLEGEEVLIADNLSIQLNVSVFQKCRGKNITLSASHPTAHI